MDVSTERLCYCCRQP